MNTKIKLLYLSVLMATISPVMAVNANPAAPNVNAQAMAPKIQPSDTWQPLKSQSVSSSTPMANSAQNTQIKSPNLSTPTSTAKPAAIPVAQSDNSFVSDAVERNKQLTELEYERSQLTLQQDISQLKLAIKKNSNALNADVNQGDNSSNNPNFAYSSANNNMLHEANNPQLLEIFIKQGQAEATLYFEGGMRIVQVGEKLGHYMVKAIDKTTVTLTRYKQTKPVILSLLNPSDP